MVDQTQMLAEDVEAGVRTTRRNALTRFSAVSAGIFAALASRGTPRASAGPDQCGGFHNFACCCLYWTPNSGHWCSGPSYGQFNCPAGYSKYIWYCCSLNQLWGCGECMTCPGGGCTCFTGTDYNCSYGWNTHSVC